jgi:hypothetical protein
MTLRKRIRKDPQVALGLAAIKAPVMASFESIRVDCKDPVIRGFIHQVLMNESGGILRRAVYTALKSLEFGFIAHEKVWKNNVKVEFTVEPDGGDSQPYVETFHNATILADVCDLDPEYTDLKVDGTSGDYFGLSYGFGGGGILPAERSWLVTHDKEFGNLRGTSVVDQIYDPWYWCDIMYLFCNRYYERKATPPIKGRAPTAVTDSNGQVVTGVEVFSSMLETLISEGVIVLPSETQGEGRSERPLWDVEYMADDKRGEMFIAYITHLQTLKLRGMLIPEMVVEKGGTAGTYGMARAHTDTFIGMLTLILEEVLQHVNRWLIPELVSHNFGPDAPPCSIDTLVKIGERKDLLEQLLLEVIKSEARVGALDTSRIVDVVALLRQLNVNTQQRRDLPDYETIMKQKQKVADAQKGQVEALKEQVAANERTQTAQIENDSAKAEVQVEVQREQIASTEAQQEQNRKAQIEAAKLKPVVKPTVPPKPAAKKAATKPAKAAMDSTPGEDVTVRLERLESLMSRLLDKLEGPQ